MADTVESRVKAWLTPMLITCFGVVSWSLITEIRSDVKLLLSANAETQIKIQNLEKRMDGVEHILYSQRTFALKPEDVDVPKRKK
jgi:hypothetical protein